MALHFRADWSTTCRAQDRALQSLKSEAGLDITVLLPLPQLGLSLIAGALTLVAKEGGVARGGLMLGVLFPWCSVLRVFPS